MTKDEKKSEAHRGVMRMIGQKDYKETRKMLKQRANDKEMD